MLALTPMAPGTEPERRLMDVVAGLGTGTGRQGGLAVFVPVVDGAMHRRQADALVFLPEAIVVVRAIGIGRQSGELEMSATGAWFVDRDILRLAGGGSTPVPQLRRATDVVTETLRAGGIDPGSPPGLVVVDGDVSAVSGSYDGAPAVSRMDRQAVIAALRRCSAEGSRRDRRVWTTADVRAALTALDVIGAHGRPPSVEELNAEGFGYSPYVLRRSGVTVHERPLPAHPQTQTPISAPMWRPAPELSRLGEPATGPLRPDVAGAEDDATGPLDSREGLAAIFTAAAAAAAAADANAEPGPDAAVTPQPAPAADPAPIGVPAGRGPGPSRRILPALAVAATLALVLVAIVVLLRSLGDAGGGLPAGGTAAADTTAATAAPPAPAPAASSPGVQEIDGISFSLATAQRDTDCAVNSYGDVAAFFVATPCSGLSRGLFSSMADGRPILVSVSVVTMPDAGAAAALRALADTDGTGNVTDLVSGGFAVTGGPAEVTGEYASAIADREVRIVETAWLDPAQISSAAALDDAATRALGLDLPSG